MVLRQTVFLSVVVLTIGMLLWRRGNRILRERTRVKATIIENIRRKDSEGSDIYYPVIQFLTVKQKLITIELNVGFLPAIAIGGKMNVVYNPNDPNDIVIWPGIQLEIVPRLLAAAGLTGLIAAALDYFGLISLTPD